MPLPAVYTAYLGCTLAEFTLALTGHPVTLFLWHFKACLLYTSDAADERS